MLSREVHHGKTFWFTKKVAVSKKCVRFYQWDCEENLISIVNFAQRNETFSDQAHDNLRHSTLLF